MARDLTRDRVTQKATEIINQLGDTKQLKLKDLAAALNIKVPSLYNHVKGLDGLMEAIHLQEVKKVEKLLRESIMGKTGREALLAAARSYRTYARANPGVYELAISINSTNKEIEEISNNIVSLLVLILGSLGLAGDAAYHTVRGFRSLLHGFVSLELSGGFQMDLDLDISFEMLINNFLQSIKS